MADAVNTKTTEPVSAEMFMGLVVSMSRLLSQLGQKEPFKDAGLGLGEWATLSAIRDSESASNKHLARTLGVTGQRVNQIADALKRDGLITAKQSKEDSRMNVLALTDAGRQRLTDLNARLTPMLADGLKGSERAIGRTARVIKRIMRVFHEQKTAGTPGPAKAA